MKVIEFLCEENYFKTKEDQPIPTKIDIPEWFKKLEHSPRFRTIKGCMPFLETLTTGYLLKIPTDYKLEFNLEKDDKGEGKVVFYTSLDGSNYLRDKHVNISDPQGHDYRQVLGSPLLKKNGGNHFIKIQNPWIIKTPPGYSCLFVPPLNNPKHDYFEIIPGIVHTDKYISQINFPMVVNGEKYEKLEMTIKRGMPYVQVIPFKRDDWKMEIKPFDENKQKPFFNFLNLSFINNYKDRFWIKNKTKWK